MASRQRSSPKKARSVVRRAEALALRVQGYSYKEIGKRLAPSITEHAAWKLVQGGLDDVRLTMAEDAEGVRVVMLRRLDRATRLVMSRIDKGELAATDRLVRLQERTARLLGLDAPDNYEHAGAGGSALAAPVLLVPSVIDESNSSKA